MPPPPHPQSKKEPTIFQVLDILLVINGRIYIISVCRFTAVAGTLHVCPAFSRQGCQLKNAKLCFKKDCRKNSLFYYINLYRIKERPTT